MSIRLLLGPTIPRGSLHGCNTTSTLLPLVSVVVMLPVIVVRIAIIAARGVRLITAFRAVCIGLLAALARHWEVRVVSVGDLGRKLAGLLGDWHLEVLLGDVLLLLHGLLLY